MVWPAPFQASGRIIECLVLALSANGAKLQLSAPLWENDKRGTLMVPRLGDFEAKVAWKDPRTRLEVGLTFTAPPEQIAALIGKEVPNSPAARIRGPEPEEDQPDTGKYETWYRLID